MLTRYLPTPERARELGRTALPWVAMALIGVVLLGPVHVRAFALAFDRHRLADDARIQLYHFYHYADAELFANDVIGKYHSDGTGDLFRLLYFSAAKLGDPMTLSHVLPIVLFVLTIVGLAMAGRNVAGRSGAFVALSLCVTAGVVHARLVGGLPRAFVYPYLAFAAAAITGGRVRTFAILSVLGAGFYPICAVIGGLTLTLWLLVVQAKDRGSARAWSLRRRLVVLALTGAGVITIVLPFALRMREHGPTIKPDMVRVFPESGRGGRSSARDRPPFPPFFEAATTVARDCVLANPKLTVPPESSARVQASPALVSALGTLVTLALALGFLRLGLANVAVRRLTWLGAATAIGYVVANAVTPSLVVPQRYVQYPVPVLVPLLVASGILGLFPGPLPRADEPRRRRWLRAAFVLVLGLGLVGLLGGRGPAPERLSFVAVNASDAGLYAAVAKLPKRALVAGWPEGAMDDMPLVSLRTPFLTRQIHMPYHMGMTLLLRTRMRALVDAYFATERGPLERLRREFGVTHLVVEWSHLEREPPSYFKPFDTDIRRAVRAAAGREYAALRYAKETSVFSDERYGLLDLARLRD